MTFPLLAPLTLDDLDHIMPLERQVFQDAWTRRMYVSDLTTNPLATYRALRPAATDAALPPVLAWGGFWLMVDEAHIATIASHPDWRGCGLGQYLLLALMDAALARGATLCTLEVRAGNVSAQTLYRKLGYVEAGRRRRYYRDGEDALIMTLFELPAPAVQKRLGELQVEAANRLTTCFGTDAAPRSEPPAAAS